MATLSNVITRVLIAALMSLVTGTIFWDLPSTDAKLVQNDRIGFHYAVMCFAVWPIMLWLTVREAASMRRHVERDIAVGLYSRTVFILFDQFLELWSSALAWWAYLVPSYAMAGLYALSAAPLDGFYFYLGYMVLYLISIQMLCRATIFLIPMEKTASIISGGCLLISTLVNGVLLHRSDLPHYVQWVNYVSPSRWVLPELLKLELSDVALRTSISKDIRCATKQRPYPDIITQASCPAPNGTQVMVNYDYNTADNMWASLPTSPSESFLIALAIFYAVFAFIGIVAFVADCTKYVKRKQKTSMKGHKVTASTP